mmetsp:Transcript_46881/g.149693  ORF Transcript_46881/g.149693 Transcript_46881/m.149693 type:complete len:318 (+) Transcript_46881:102-1055(+)
MSQTSGEVFSASAKSPQRESVAAAWGCRRSPSQLSSWTSISDGVGVLDALGEVRLPVDRSCGSPFLERRPTGSVEPVPRATSAAQAASSAQECSHRASPVTSARDAQPLACSAEPRVDERPISGSSLEPRSSPKGQPQRATGSSGRSTIPAAVASSGTDAPAAALGSSAGPACHLAGPPGVGHAGTDGVELVRLQCARLREQEALTDQRLAALEHVIASIAPGAEGVEGYQQPWNSTSRSWHEKFVSEPLNGFYIDKSRIVQREAHLWQLRCSEHYPVADWLAGRSSQRPGAGHKVLDEMSWRDLYGFDEVSKGGLL